MSADREWMTSAACRGRDPQFFFPEGKGRNAKIQADRAARFCRANCSVIAECAEYRQQTGSAFGVWAAKHFNEEKRVGQTTPAPQPHGTEAAYMRHKRRGEEPCDVCKAGAKQARDRRRPQRAGAA